MTKEYQYCPISESIIDQNKARMTAILVAVLSMIFILTDSIWIMIVLNLDFFLRGFISSKDGILKYVTGYLSKVIKVREKPTRALPKIFAAKVGYILTLAILLFSLFQSTISEILAAILIVFALLEGILGICVGCYAYTVLHKLFK